MSLILALESSCDDSAAALVGSDRQILAQAVVGQNDAHRPFGGIVPEIAARAHVEILPGLVRYDEVASGEIRHAIRLTVPQTRNAFVWPARHKASALTGSPCSAMA